MSVEERLRATTEAVTAAMRPVRPLDLPSSLSEARAAAQPGRARPPRRWPGWLVPVAAAAAVIAVAATLVAVRNLSGAASGAPVTPAATSTTLANGAPRYYVALPGFGTSEGGASVRNAYLADAGTGKRLATFKPPVGAIFTGVAASADDKTFVLDATLDVGTSGSFANASPRAHTLSVLRLTPGVARQAQVSRMPPGFALTDAVIWGLAVSPDGRTLAVLSQKGVSDASHGTSLGPITLRTYSLATGQDLRTWTGPTPKSQTPSAIAGDNIDRLSWLDDGHTLAFADPKLSTHQVIRTVNTNHPGTDLLADSRPVFSVPAGCSSPLMTSDGQAVICGNGESHPGCVNPPPELTVYSVATGKPERVLYRYRGGCSFGFAQVVWAKSGTLAIGDIEISKSVDLLPPATNIVGVVTPNKFTSLPVTLVGEGYSSGRIAF